MGVSETDRSCAEGEEDRGGVALPGVDGDEDDDDDVEGDEGLVKEERGVKGGEKLKTRQAQK